MRSERLVGSFSQLVSMECFEVIRVYVTDRKAKVRSKIYEIFQRSLSNENNQIGLLKTIDMRCVEPAELKYLEAPNLLVQGCDSSRNDDESIAEVCKLLPDTPMIAWSSSKTMPLESIERLSFFKFVDICSEATKPTELVGKILLHAKKIKPLNSGKFMLVAAGKGGSGGTTISAAIGEMLLHKGYRVAIIDLDDFSQSLTRFLQVKPCINENLQLLLEGARPIVGEFIEHAYSQVWKDESFSLVTPVGVANYYGLTGPDTTRRLLQVIDYMKGSFDWIIVDSNIANRLVQRSLLKVADYILVILNNDPASLFAATQAIRENRIYASPAGTLVPLCNCTDRNGLNPSFIKGEIGRADKSYLDKWGPTIPYCSKARNWPGSGGTAYSFGGKMFKHGIREIASLLHLHDPKSPYHTKSRQVSFAIKLLLPCWGSSDRRRRIGTADVESPSEGDPLCSSSQGVSQLNPYDRKLNPKLVSSKTLEAKK
jgi:hypothetical protein